MTAFSGIVRVFALCAVGLAALAPPSGRAEETAVARLAQVLAAKEAADGKASPDLLPVIEQLAQVLAAKEAADGKASPDLLPAIEQLAQAHLIGGGFDEALALRRRALAIAIGAVGCDSAMAADAMASLALLDIDRRDYLEAEPLLLIAERTLSSRVEADHPALAVIYAGRARVALARGEVKPAAVWARRAMAIARANPHGRSAETLRTLGAVLATEQRFAEAERVLTEALAQDRRQQGADGLDTARSLSQLASLYLRQGRPAAALPLLQQATAIDQARLGPNHPFIADDLHDLGLVYDALDRKAAARRAFLAAIALLERGAGRNTVRVAYAEIELSRLYRQAGDAEAADAAFRNARRILNKAEADEHRRERRV